jgi:hypothetical protein
MRGSNVNSVNVLLNDALCKRRSEMHTSLLSVGKQANVELDLCESTNLLRAVSFQLQLLSAFLINVSHRLLVQYLLWELT